MPVQGGHAAGGGRLHRGRRRRRSHAGSTPWRRHALHLRPLRRVGAGRDAEPGADLHVPAGQRDHRGRGRVRARDLLDARPPRLPPAGDRRGHRRAAGRLSPGAGRPRLRGGGRAGSRDAALDAQLPDAGRAAAGRYAARRYLRAVRPGAGVAAVVLPLEEHPGRRAARLGGRGPSARAGGADATGATPAGRPSAPSGSWTTSPGSGCRCATSTRRIRTARCSPVSTTPSAAAMVRETQTLRPGSGADRPADPGAADGQLHLPE